MCDEGEESHSYSKTCCGTEWVCCPKRKIVGFRESLSTGIGSSSGRRDEVEGVCERKIGLGMSGDKGNADSGGKHLGTVAHVTPVFGRLKRDDCHAFEGIRGYWFPRFL